MSILRNVFDYVMRMKKRYTYYIVLYYYLFYVSTLQIAHDVTTPISVICTRHWYIIRLNFVGIEIYILAENVIQYIK